MRGREMKVPPPSSPASWSEGARHGALLGVTLLVAGALLLLKLALIGPFVAALVPASVASLLAVLAAGLGAGRALRLTPGEAATTSLPALVVLIIALANTPMAYEVESFVGGMPHPEGGERTQLRVLRPFDARHPSTQVEWTYPAGTDATALTLAAQDAFSRGRWEVVTSSSPGANAFGYVLAQRYAFSASCTVWDAPTARVACLVTV